MLFFLHIAALLHGAFGLLVAFLRSKSLVWSLVVEALPDNVLAGINATWPDQIYQPWEPGTSEEVPQPQRAYLICSAEVLWSVFYLFSNHRSSRS